MLTAQDRDSRMVTDMAAGCSCEVYEASFGETVANMCDKWAVEGEEQLL